MPADISEARWVLNSPDPLYYLKNFEFLLRYAGNLFRDILTEPEKIYAENFLSLPEQARCLYVRLAGRKGPLFRADKIRYPEIPDREGAASNLETAGLMTINPHDADPGFLLDLLLAEELRDLLRALEIPFKKSARRDELLALGLVEIPPGQLEGILFDGYRVYRPEGLRILDVYRLCFFGNLRQDLTEFVTTALGIVRYETVPIEPGERFFSNREDLDAAMDLYSLRQEAALAMEEQGATARVATTDQGNSATEESGESNFPEPVSGLIAGWLSRVPGGGGNPVTAARRDRFVNRLARELERLGEPAMALRAYNMAGDPPARERRARILNRMGSPPDALHLCEEILASPLSEEELEFADSFSRRLRKALGLEPLPARKVPVVAQDTVTLPRLWPECGEKGEGASGHARGVEDLAAAWLSSLGGNALHVENTLFAGLFGMIFWDLIFLPVKGAFCNPFQAGPADLYLPSFRRDRSSGFKRRLEEVRDGQGPEIARRIWKTRHGVMNAMVNWKFLDVTIFEEALEKIPADHLARIFDRMAFDLKANSSGLPDLIHFPAAGGYELVEVKGPGDRLQANQKRWFAHFAEWGIPARVLKIEYA